ncbi:hypothetical protein SLEP1_g22881 [Rubroshorea leprosula]|uniref:Uncharacterized protein n=1 Tax=Rubroshorea leprosula TaxID=152421 RepID=A0AAV5JGP7_9ROSI|nr:hypothetical protein SLEP1_g22881 [Rubroshorea leprosula]
MSVGADMDPEFIAKLEECLRRHEGIFAGSAADMPGIDPEVTCQRLRVPLEAVPVRQKMRQFGAKRTAAIKEEIEKLKEAGFIKEINFCEWLSNIVMVKRANGKWRMCIDFTDLNKVCPKDNYALPNIDELVDNSFGYEILSFCDAYSGYNQTPLAKEDQDKTAFIVAGETYCYIVMPFGLKNARATYQRFANKIFVLLKGKCVEVYVDDLIIKSRSLDQHLEDLEQVFSILQEYGMKLNPLKCTFGVKAGKFLSFMLTNRGIEANPEKVLAIIEMKPPASIKEVQHLMGKIVALGRFLSKSTERCLPIFEILRGKKIFEWTQDCQRAFEQLKAYLASPPLISKPSPGETLFLYITATTEVVNAALIRQEQKRQRPVYFVSKVLQEPEKRYAPLEKLAYAVIIATRRLRYYFLGHKITVLTNYPLRHVLHKPDLVGRLVKWSIDLIEFDVEFQPRKAMKAQVLADFIVELSKAEKAALDTPLPTPPAKRQSLEIEEEQARAIPPDLCWVLHVDGSSSENGSGAGIILTSSEGETFEYALKFTFEASNNRAEYEALLGGLRLASSGVTESGKEIYVEELSSPSISEEEFLEIEEEEVTWMNPIKRYLSNGDLLEDKKEAQKLKRKAACSMTFCKMGDGHPWALPKSKRKKEVPYSCNRLLHEMGGSRGSGQNNRTKNRRVCKDMHHMQNLERRFTIKAQLENEGKTPEQIEQRFASVAYPESNGQAEAANRIILDSLKKKVGKAKGSWTEELLYTLWAYRTMYCTSTGETPFNLTYGTKAVILVETRISMHRTSHYNEHKNKETLRANLDLLEEVRDLLQIRMASYHRKAEKYYNRKVKPKNLCKGDWVLRRAKVSERNPREGKLCPSWEGPYLIKEDLGNGAFKLIRPKGAIIPRTWNATHLKKYHW